MTTKRPATLARERGRVPIERASSPVPEDWRLRVLIARHKRIAAGAGLVLAAIVAFFIAIAVGPTGQPLADSTACLVWGSASQTTQLSYEKLFLREHGNIPGQAPGVAGVAAAVNKGCLTAFNSDEENSVTLLDAVEGRY